MPYIPLNTRRELKKGRAPQNPGELNYMITLLCTRYILEHGLKYENINAVIGALSCANQEFYRRLAAPYEDLKIKCESDLLEYVNLADQILRTPEKW